MLKHVHLNVYHSSPFEILFDALQSLPDYRAKYLVTHPLQPTLFLVAYVHLCGATTQRNKEAFLRTIWQKVRAVCEGLGVECANTAPSDSTIGRLCKRIDVEKLGKIVEKLANDEYASELKSEPQSDIVPLFALDGKARIAAPTGTGKYEMDVSVFDARRKLLVGKISIGAKEGEQPAAREAVAKFAPSLPSGYFTADAGISCRALTKTITENFHDYLLTVKENAGEIYYLLRGLPWDEFDCETGSIERGHGRMEWRFLHMSRVPRGNLDVLDAYADLSIVGRVERYRIEESTGERTRGYAYFLASEKHNELTEATALDGLRSHWAIENNLHRTRDVELGEDDLMTMSCSSSRTIGTFLDLVPYIARGTGAGIRYFMQTLRADPMAILESWLVV